MTQFDPSAPNSYQQQEQNFDNQQQANNPPQGTPYRNQDGSTGYAQAQDNDYNQRVRQQLQANQQEQDNRTAFERQRQEHQRQADQSVQAAGEQNSSTGKTKLKILEDHAGIGLEDPHHEKLRQHALRRLPDYEINQDPKLGQHYEFMAKLDPSSASFDPPAHDLVPMPRGGLDTLVQMKLGRPPVAPVVTAYDDYNKFITDDRAYQEAKAVYDEQAGKLRHFIYRMNTDSLRTEDRYTLGQLVRVPNETV